MTKLPLLILDISVDPLLHLSGRYPLANFDVKVK